MADESLISFSAGGVMFTGDAILLYQAKVIRQGLKACRTGLRLNRAYTPTKCLQAAGRITTRQYRRGPAEIDRAISDLNDWISACEAAMPVEVRADA